MIVNPLLKFAHRRDRIFDSVASFAVIDASQRNAQDALLSASDGSQRNDAMSLAVTLLPRQILIHVKRAVSGRSDKTPRNAGIFRETGLNVSMTTFDAAERLNMRLQERAHTDLGLSRLSGLRARSQFVRLGNRYALSSVGSGHIYIAAKGVIGLEAGATGSDVRVITSLLYPGDILAPDLGGSLPNLALISQRPAEFWKVTASSFADETLRDADLWQTVFTRLNDQIARSQLHTAAMSMLNSEERVAAFLIEMATRLGTASSGTIAYELPLSRYSIADYLSLNADTISRTFSALATARVLERRGRFQVVVRDWEALLERCPMSDAIIAAHGGGKPQLIR